MKGSPSSLDVAALDIDFSAYVDACAARLSAVGIREPRGDAIRLLERVLGSSKLATPAAVFRLLEQAISQREQRRSHARILGRCQFRGLEIDLTDDVYEPCPSSEMLIEYAIDYARSLR